MLMLVEAVRPNLSERPGESARQRKARINRTRPYWKFVAATSQRFPVGPEDDQQKAAKLLLRRGWIAYRGMSGLLCDIGLPKHNQQAGRTFKWRPPCASCNIHTPVKFSPPHDAYFCWHCLGRINPELHKRLAQDDLNLREKRFLARQAEHLEAQPPEAGNNETNARKPLK